MAGHTTRFGGYNLREALVGRPGTFHAKSDTGSPAILKLGSAGQSRRRFERELELLHAVTHPLLLAPLEIVSEGAIHALVYEGFSCQTPSSTTPERSPHDGGGAPDSQIYDYGVGDSGRFTHHPQGHCAEQHPYRNVPRNKTDWI
jgi:hypothetical protein